MAKLETQIREIILGAGYDLPQGPVLPPMDLVDEELRKLGVGVGRVAMALGREVDCHVYATTAPAVRSLTEVRRAVGGMLLVAAGAAVQLGMDPEAVLLEMLADGQARGLLIGQMSEVGCQMSGSPEMHLPPLVPCAAASEGARV